MRLAIGRGPPIPGLRPIDEQKQLDDLLKTVLISPKGTDVSARSPKTGESSMGLLVAYLLSNSGGSSELHDLAIMYGAS